MRLTAERGIDATTTRALAEEAGVNEVTIFRLFGDKAGLAAEAVRVFASTTEFDSYPIDIDASNPRRAAEGIVSVLNLVRRRMLEGPALVPLGMAGYWRFPQLRTELAATPRAAKNLIERTLTAARPTLRPGLDIHAASLTLIGLLLVSVVWPARGWTDLSEDEWRATANQAVESLLQYTCST
jgi:AcrR family transcriptional regulator